MRKIIESTLVSADGVIGDPPRWAMEYRDAEVTAEALERLASADAMLMGRGTYELFSAVWPDQSGEFADRMNSIRKYVFSATLDEASWNNSVPGRRRGRGDQAKHRRRGPRHFRPRTPSAGTAGAGPSRSPGNGRQRPGAVPRGPEAWLTFTRVKTFGTGVVVDLHPRSGCHGCDSVPKIVPSLHPACDVRDEWVQGKWCSRTATLGRESRCGRAVGAGRGASAGAGGISAG